MGVLPSNNLRALWVGVVWVILALYCGENTILVNQNLLVNCYIYQEKIVLITNNLSSLSVFS